jgi:hypothetical protein
LTIKEIRKIKGTPYSHFESKENYLNMVLKHISTIFDGELIKDMDVSQNAGEQLIKIDFYMQF